MHVIGENQAAPDDAREHRIRRFLLVVWLALSVAVLCYVGMFARNTPYVDEWAATVPLLTGAVPADVQHLMQRHCEHIIIVPRLILLAIGALTGCDFRIPMWISAGCLILAARLAQLALRAARGRSAWLDAFPLLLLLNFGHEENLLIGFQLQFVTISLGSVALMYLMTTTTRPSFWRAGSAAAIMVFMAFSNVVGAMLALAASFWLLLLAFAPGSEQGTRPHRATQSALVLLAALVMVSGWIGLPPLGQSTAARGALPELLVSCVTIQANAIGLVARVFPRLLGGFVGGCMAVAFLLALRPAWARREGTLVGGLTLMMLGLLLTGGAIVFGRQGLCEDAIFACRYYTIFAPLLIAVALLLTRYAPRRIAVLLLVLLVGMEAVLWPAHAYVGWRLGARWKAEYAAFEKDVLVGRPLPELAIRHAHILVRSGTDNIALFTRGAQGLHDRGIGVFARIKPATPAPEPPANR